MFKESMMSAPPSPKMRNMGNAQFPKGETPTTPTKKDLDKRIIPSEDLPPNFDKYTDEEKEFYLTQGANPGKRVELTPEQSEMLRSIAKKEGLYRPKKEGAPDKQRPKESPEKIRDRNVLKSALSELRSETSALNKQYLDATRPWTSRRGIILNGEWTPEDTTQYTDEQKKSSKAATAKLELGQLALIGAQEALGLNKPVPPGTKEALQHVEGIYAERVRSGHKDAQENPELNARNQQLLQEIADLIHRLNG